MPYSSESGKKYVRYLMGKIEQKKVLDVGCGAGTYAKMFPDRDWTGIEIWEPYVEKYNLRDLYKNLIVEDARKVDYGNIGTFDVAIAGDVLEHMELDEARDVVHKLREISDTVIVSIPIGHYPQGEYAGNPYEKHVVDDWTNDRILKVFGSPTWSVIDNEIGIYAWSKTHTFKPKICVYSISKNEEKFVKRWADSAKDADLILLADTGSSDDTVKIAKECGISVHQICITPWRFDHARNASIALIPKDIDICISLDVDEMMEPGWREEIERVWKPDTTRLRYYFDWGCGIKFMYEKIHARHGYYWHHPCHEYPRPDARITEVWAHTDKLLVSHHPDPTKSRGQYMDLLDLSVKEDPTCPRNAFYYARELSFHGKWHEAIEACKKYLEMPNATWMNERCYAMRVIGKCYEGLNNLHEAEMWYHRAAAEAPNTREPWVALSLIYYTRKHWLEAYAAAMRALSIRNRDLVYTCDPTVWGASPHDLAAISAWNLGMAKEAIEQGELAVNLEPENARLVENLKWFKGEKVAN